jgi:hypothetical protein
MTEPEYVVLKEKAREYRQMADLAVANDLDDQAVQNYNFALELLMKAVLSKEGLNYPKTHNLLEISNTRNSGNVKILRDAVNSGRTIKPMWDRIHSVWNPDQRYVLGPEGADYSDLFTAYERVYGWINSRFF